LIYICNPSLQQTTWFLFCSLFVGTPIWYCDVLPVNTSSNLCGLRILYSIYWIHFRRSYNHLITLLVALTIPNSCGELLSRTVKDEFLIQTSSAESHDQTSSPTAVVIIA
jgi:hypothetical protein